MQYRLNEALEKMLEMNGRTLHITPTALRRSASTALYILWTWTSADGIRDKQLASSVLPDAQNESLEETGA